MEIVTNCGLFITLTISVRASALRGCINEEKSPYSGIVTIYVQISRLLNHFPVLEGRVPIGLHFEFRFR
eukprot:1640780-Amphidinium_carterae.1